MVCFVWRPSQANAQSDGILQVEHPLSKFLLRQQIQGRLPHANLSLLPLSIHDAQPYLDSLIQYTDKLSPADQKFLRSYTGGHEGAELAWLRRQFGWAFENGRDLVSFTGDDYDISVNPLLYLSYGPLLNAPDSLPGSSSTWRNTRGARVAGSIGSHVFFETRLEENQRKDPRIVFDPGDKTATRLGETEYDETTGVFDYMVATGVAGFRSQHFEIRFGRDRNRWGYGRGSLFLSDFPTVFDQLQIRTTVGRFQYTSLFASLATARTFNRDSIIPKKYAAMHRLNIRATDNLQFALFESVMFATDSLGARQGFDLAYLNPIIFYRAVESDRGSPDNVLLGAAIMWRPVPGVQLHSELLLDELRVSRIGDKWWANKWGFQAGISATPARNIFASLEYTRLRPYIYSHREPLNAYIHFADILGHPAGPNSSDIQFFGNWQLSSQLEFNLDLSHTVRGLNDANNNYGSDPAITNTTRVSDEDVSILQGIRARQTLLNAQLGYTILPYVVLEAGFWMDRKALSGSSAETLAAPILTLRWGLPQNRARF